MRKILSLFFLTALLIGSISAQVTVQGQPHPTAKHTPTKARPQFKSDTNFTFNDIKFWVGSGSKKAALVIEWHDGKSPDALVWGYRWDGEANGLDMIVAIAQADPRLVLLTQYTGSMGYTICGIGYSEQGLPITYDLEGAIADPKIQFRVTDAEPEPNPSLGQTSFPETPAEDISVAIRNGAQNGVIYHPLNVERYGYPSYDYDHWYCDAGSGHWNAGWYKGYWSYFVKDSQSGTFSYSGLGAIGRQLTDGSWDAWSWNGDMGTTGGTGPGDSFIAAPTDTPPGPDIDEPTPPMIGVTGVTLNATVLRLQTGRMATLTASIVPVNADDKSVSWKTSNNEVATVNNGVVTGVKPGTARITVTTTRGNHSAYCDITITETVVPELTFDGSAATLSFPKVTEATSYEVRVYHLKSNKPILKATYVTDADGNIITELRTGAQLLSTESISVTLKNMDRTAVYSIEIRVLKGLDIIDTYYADNSSSVSNETIVPDNRRGFYTDNALHLVNLTGYHLYLFNMNGQLKETLKVMSPTETHSLPLSPGFYILTGKNGTDRVNFKFQVAY